MIGSMTLRAPDLLDDRRQRQHRQRRQLRERPRRTRPPAAGPITLGDDACVSSYAILEGNTARRRARPPGRPVGAGRRRRVPAGRIWTGSPARDAGAFDPRAAAAPGRHARAPGRRSAVLRLRHPADRDAVLHAGVPELRADRLVRRARLLPWLQGEQPSGQLARYFVLAFPASAVLIVLTALLSAGIRWTVLPRLKPGRSAGPQQHLLRQMAGQPHPGIEPERPARHLRHRVRAVLVPPAGRQGRTRRRDLHRAGRGAGHADAGRRNLHRRCRHAGRRADRRRLDDDAADRGLAPQLRRQRRLHPGRHGAAGARADRRALARAGQRRA